MGRGFLSGIFWSALLLFGGLATLSLVGPPPQGPVPVVNSTAPDTAPDAASAPRAGGDAGDAPARTAGTDVTAGRSGAPAAPAPASPQASGDLGALDQTARADAGERPGAATDVTAPGGTGGDSRADNAAGAGDTIATLGSDAPALPPTAAEAPATPGTDQMPTLEKTLDRPVKAEVAAQAPDQPRLNAGEDDPQVPGPVRGSVRGSARGPASGAGRASSDAPDPSRGPDTLAAAAPQSPAGPKVDASAAIPQAGISGETRSARLEDQDRPALPRQASRPARRGTPEGAAGVGEDPGAVPGTPPMRPAARTGSAIPAPLRDKAPGPVASPASRPESPIGTSQADTPGDSADPADPDTPPAAADRPMLADGDDNDFDDEAPQTTDTPARSALRREQARPVPPAGVSAAYAPTDGPRPVARPDDLGVTARLEDPANQAGPQNDPQNDPQSDAASDQIAAIAQDPAPEGLTAPSVPRRSPLAAPSSDDTADSPPRTPRIIRPGGARPLLQGEAQAAERESERAAALASEADAAPGLAIPGPDASRADDLPPVERFAVRHADSASRPLMSVVLIDVPGQSLTAAQLKALTFPVTFAIDPSRGDASTLAAKYRAAGHEVLMLAETLARKGSASGAETLLDGYAKTLPEAVGLMDIQAGGIQGKRALQSQVIDLLAERGYGFVLYDRGLNSTAAAARREGVPTGLIFRMLDAGRERAEVIRRYLDRAAFKAGKDGSVVMVGHTYPETVKGLVGWALDGRAAALSLAPVTAIMLQGERGERG